MGGATTAVATGNRFKPGNQFAKLGDHKRSRLVTQQIISSINEIDIKDPLKRTNLRVMIEALVQVAKTGDVKAIQFITERIEGAPQLDLGDGHVLMVVRAPATADTAADWAKDHTPQMIDVTPAKGRKNGNGA